MMLTVDKGSFSYPHGQPVLKDVSFSLAGGQIMAVLGPNGIGKTTLLKCVIGLLRWSRGESRLDGRSIAALDSRRLWQTVSYVPQARSTNVIYTGRQMIMLGRSARLGPLQTPGPGDMEVVDQVCARLGIQRLTAKACNRMSGGELQMVMIARALAAQSRLLVFDEPESGLDFRNQLLIMDTIRQLAADDGIACLFNTHYPEHALRIADQALLLGQDGSYVCDAAPQVVSDDNLTRFFGVRIHVGDVDCQGHHYPAVIPLALR